MNKLFQLMVIIWIVFHVSWVVFSIDVPFLEMVAVALVAAGFWMFFGILLLRRLRFIRLLLLLAVIGWIALLWSEPLLWMSDYHDFGAMAEDPSTSWATNVSLLLNGLLLVMAYLTPVAVEFEKQGPLRRTKIGRLVAAVTRTDGAMMTIPTVTVLVVLVVNQVVIGARYAESSPHTLIAGASEYLRAAEATGDMSDVQFAYFELGDAYWLLRERDQAAPMYEKVVALEGEKPEFSSWLLSRSIVRLMQYYTAASDTRFGDGSHALEIAQWVSEGAKGAAYFDALAAIYARLGQGEKAIYFQEIAVDRCVVAGCCENYWGHAHRLDQYRYEFE